MHAIDVSRPDIDLPGLGAPLSKPTSIAFGDKRRTMDSSKE